MQTIIDWKPIDKFESVINNMGWYVVVLKPVNYKECDNKGWDYSNWIYNFGFERAWNNNDKWFIADMHGRNSIEVTDRVMLYADLPHIKI